MIELEGLTKRYRQVVAIEGITLSLQPGQVVALVGPNGSGKSTLLKLCAGLIRPTQGKVRVFGYDPFWNPPHALRHISYLPQRPELPAELSVWEVVDFFRRLRGLPPERTEEVLRTVGLFEMEQADKLCRELSGGLAQRTTLAIALLAKVDFLLLDEPTAQLDPRSAKDFFDFLKETHTRNEGPQGIIIATHMLDELVGFADRIVFLYKGRVVGDLDRQDLNRRVEELEQLRIEVEGDGDEVVRVAQEAGARKVSSNAKGYLVVADPEGRARVVSELERRGLRVRSLEVIPGRLEQLYLKLIDQVKEDQVGK